jgi:hypothetical protein
MTAERPLEAAAQEFREAFVTDALRAARPATPRSLHVADTSVELLVADPDIGAILLPALRHHIVESAGTPAGTTTRSARVIVWSTPMPPFPWSGRHLGRGGAIVGLSHGPVRATAGADGTSVMLWDSTRRLACCWFAGPTGVTRWDRAAPLRTALHFALATPQRQLVHGAVVGVDGRGVLLAGPGGSGKSTTTLACLEAGMQIVGDDYAAIELGHERVRAWNLYGSIKVGERGKGPGGRDGRRTLLLGHDLPGTPTETLDLQAILIPRIGDRRESRTNRANPADALRALAPSTLLQAPHEEGQTLGILADLARSVPAYHLHLGADRGVPAIRAAVSR